MRLMRVGYRSIYVHSIVWSTAHLVQHPPRNKQYPFTTLIPNLGVWIPSQAYDSEDSIQPEGSGSEGLVLCVSDAYIVVK